MARNKYNIDEELDAPFNWRQFKRSLVYVKRYRKQIALMFALAHPERVEKLILNGANLDASGVKPRIQIPIEIGYRIAKLFSKKSPEARKNAELLGLMVNDPNVKPEELARIQCPTLVIAGSNDMIKENHTRLIAQSIPGAQLVIIPGSHFVANKAPGSFNAAVLRFLL